MNSVGYVMQDSIAPVIPPLRVPFQKLLFSVFPPGGELCTEGLAKERKKFYMLFAAI
jgi:hypothetical protein